MSVQNKIAVLFTVLAAAIISLISISIYVFVSKNIRDSFFHRLEVRGRIVGSAYLDDNTENSSLYYEVKEKHLKNLPEENHHFVRVDPKQEPGLEDIPELPLPETFFRNTMDGKQARYLSGCVSYVGQYISKDNKGVIVISSAEDFYGDMYLTQLRKFKFLGFCCSLLIVFTAGKIFSYHIFKPIRKIVKNVKGIHAHNLNQRLENHNGKDEIADLTYTFNDMLNRLHITFEMQNNFISNASHELKTPLTVVAGEAELGKGLPDINPEARLAFETILKESERLEHLVRSMLALAQTGFDGKVQQREVIRLDELLMEVKKTTDKINKDNYVCLNFDNLPENEEALEVYGNVALLKVAFSNVINNACKYSKNKKVVVKVFCQNDYIRVDVFDTGIGIPPKDLPQVFIPFFRGSNTGDFKGHGIGLPLANNILKMHRGHLNIISEENEHTTVSVYLPKA